MKKIIFTLACCAIVAPLAFAKDSKQTKPWHFAFITEKPITITAPGSTSRVEGGSAASYQPASALVVHQDGAGRYVLEGAGRLFNSKGDAIHTRSVKPGTRLHVYFASEDGIQTIDRVVVD
ncbi:MAG: hypothetical protein ACJ8M1_07395 [Chthoniobacterales bacterium]